MLGGQRVQHFQPSVYAGQQPHVSRPTACCCFPSCCAAPPPLREPDPFDISDGVLASPFGGPQSAMGAGGLFNGLGNGNGAYSVQTMIIASSIGQDGRIHTERFSSSAVGVGNRQIQEVQQAYANSSSGMNKMSLEQQLKDHGRKVVKELSHASGEERSTDMYRGMTEERSPEFERQWLSEAVPYLPPHAAGGLHTIMAGASGRPAMLPNQPWHQGYHDPTHGHLNHQTSLASPGPTVQHPWWWPFG